MASTPRPENPLDIPVLEQRPAPGGTRGIALFCHGGTVVSLDPPRERALSLARMRAIEQFVHATCAERGIATALVRYRRAGWNGQAADAYQDVRWALEQLRRQHGRDLPIVLVGHSMGGGGAAPHPSPPEGNRR